MDSPTPGTDALCKSIDSNDVRAWRTLADRLERELAAARASAVSIQRTDQQTINQIMERALTAEAERDALRAELDDTQALLSNAAPRHGLTAYWWSVAIEQRRKRIAAEKERDALRAENENVLKLLHDWRESFKDNDCFREDSDCQLMLSDTTAAIDRERTK